MMETSNSAATSGRLKNAGDAFDRNEFTQALVAAEEALAENPNSELALAIKAGSLAALERFEAFDETIQQALSMYPARTWPLVSQSLILAQRGDAAGASEAADSATEIDPDDPRGWDALAEGLMVGGAYAAALDASRKASSIDPDNPAFWATQAQAAYLAGDTNLALGATDEALKREAEQPEAWLIRAYLIADREGDSKGLPAAEKAKELQPENASAWAIFGTTLTANGRYAESIEAFERALQLEPENPNHLVNIAIGRLNEKEFEQALPLFEQAFDSADNDLDVKGWIGVTYGELEEFRKALGIFEEILEEDPERGQVWQWRGTAEHLLGWHEQAANSFRSALSHGGWDESELWLRLGGTCAAMDRLESANRCYTQARDLDRSSIDAWIGVAVVEIKQGRQLSALKTLGHAEIAVGPSAIIEFNRGVARSQLRQSGDAQRAWRRARELDSEFSAAELLIQDEATTPTPGGWVEYWFGHGKHWFRKASGGLLTLLLLITLFLVVLRPGLIPGFADRDPELKILIPVVGLALVLFLPTIRSLTVGSVSLEALPVNADIRQTPFDPVRIDPALEPGDIKLPQS